MASRRTAESLPELYIATLKEYRAKTDAMLRMAEDPDASAIEFKLVSAEATALSNDLVELRIRLSEAGMPIPRLDDSA